MALKEKSKGAKAKKKAGKKLNKARGKASQGAGSALDWAGPRLDSAKDVAVAKAGEAREWATPRLESARETVETEVVPRVQTALNQAAEAAGPAMEEAKSRGTRAVAALKGDELLPPTPKKKHRARKVVLVLLGVAVVGGVAAAIWSRRSAGGFDYYSLPADDFDRTDPATNGSAPASTAPLGSVADEDKEPGAAPAEQFTTRDADATEAVEKPKKKTGGRTAKKSQGDGSTS